MRPRPGRDLHVQELEAVSGAPFLILETLGGDQIPLADPTRFGRATDNAVVLRDVSVSSHHAVIRKDGAFWIVEDLGSTNGTWLNHRRVDGRAVIKEGDQIQMGSQMIRVGGFRSGAPRPDELPACPRCTKVLPGGAAFCPACGLPLVPPVSVNPDAGRVPVFPTAPFAVPYPPEVLPPWKSKPVLGWIIAAVLLALLCLLAGWWAWEGSQKSRVGETGTKSARGMVAPL